MKKAYPTEKRGRKVTGLRNYVLRQRGRHTQINSPLSWVCRWYSLYLSITDTSSCYSLIVRTNYTITLSIGAGTYAARQMSYGTHRLNYNIYRNAARTRILGDGTASTVVISDNRRIRNYTVYGRIPARQNVYAGSYSDSLIMSVYF